MNQDQFDQVLALHRLWLLDNRYGARADLTHCTLQDVNAVNSELIGAIFNSTKLFQCDFTNADLTDITATGLCSHGTNFTDATLNNAHLHKAVFFNTIFDNTKLWDVFGDGVYIISLQLGRSNVCYTSDILQINCKQFDLKEIWWMSADEILVKVAGHTDEEYDVMKKWWDKWRSQIYQIVNNNPAKSTNILEGDVKPFEKIS